MHREAIAGALFFAGLALIFFGVNRGWTWFDRRDEE